jgi:hypothetical protein
MRRLPGVVLGILGLEKLLPGTNLLQYICVDLVPGFNPRDEKGNRCKSGAIPVAVNSSHHAYDEQLDYITTVVQVTTGRESKLG